MLWGIHSKIKVTFQIARAKLFALEIKTVRRPGYAERLPGKEINGSLLRIVNVKRAQVPLVRR